MEGNMMGKRKIVENTVFPEIRTNTVKTRLYDTIQERNVAHILDAFYNYQKTFSPRIYKDELVKYIEQGEMVEFWERLKHLCEKNIRMENQEAK